MQCLLEIGAVNGMVHFSSPIFLRCIAISLIHEMAIAWGSWCIGLYTKKNTKVSAPPDIIDRECKTRKKIMCSHIEKILMFFRATSKWISYWFSAAASFNCLELCPLLFWLLTSLCAVVRMSVCYHTTFKITTS